MRNFTQFLNQTESTESTSL